MTSLDVLENSIGLGQSQVPGFPPFPGATPETDIIRLRCLSAEICPSSSSSITADPACPGGPCHLCAAGGLACNPSLFIPPTNEIAQNTDEKWTSDNRKSGGRFDWRNFAKGSEEQKSHWNLVRRVNRFVWRAYLGAAIAIAVNERSTGNRVCRLRWFSLGFGTEMQDSVEVRDVLHDFDQWLRRHCGGDYEFIRVEQRVPHQHFHTISRGTERIPVLEANAWLEKRVGICPRTGKAYSHVSGLEEVDNVSKSIVYLSGYLKAMGKFVQYRESQRWGGPRGNMAHCQRVRRVTGELVSREELIELALLPESEGRAVVASYAAAHPRPSGPLYESADGYGSYESINAAPLYASACNRRERAELDAEWRRLGAERDREEVLRCMRLNFESVRCVEECPPFTFGLRL
jgi:hypothetical protein